MGFAIANCFTCSAESVAQPEKVSNKWLKKFNETVSALISSPEIGVLDVIETAVAIVFNHICENGLIG
jgi:hypothetical protein